MAGQSTTQPPLYGGSSASAAPRAQSGSSTAGIFAPVLDSEKRPITAGGFVKTGPIIFQDISKKAGLTIWQHKMGTLQKPFILETIGSGVALLDYDNDGWLDVYLVNGSTYDALDGKAEPPHAVLFRNNHDGTFTDAAEKAGVTNGRWGFGVAVGDFRQRWLAGSLRRQFQQERRVSQQPRRHIHRCCGKCWGDARQLVHRAEFW